MPLLLAFSEEAPDKVEAFLRNTAQMNLLRMPPLETLCCDYHEDICQQIDHNLAQLILEVTQRCNFRCKYCIYNSSYEGNHDFSAANMSWDTAKQAIDYLFAHSAERKNIYLTFYGGEPLLQFDLIKQATLYAQNLATQESRNLYFNLTTNLSLMTAEMARFFADIPNFSLTVSIDGLQECNSCRVYADGRPTISDAERGMHYVCHAFREAGKGLTISSVLTPPFDYDKLDRINAYFENFPELPKETSIVITYPSDGTYDCEAYTKRVYNNPRYWDLGSYDPLAKWQLTQAIRHSLSWDSTNNLYFRALVDSMMRIKNRFASEKPALRTSRIEACCVPGVRKVYVHTDGGLSICERIGTSPSIGTIAEGNLSRKDLAELLDISDYFLVEIELGRRGVSNVTLCKLADALCTTTDYLLRGIHGPSDIKSITALLESVDEPLLHSAERLLKEYINGIHYIRAKERDISYLGPEIK